MSESWMIILNSWLVALFAGTFVMKDFSVKLHVHSDERALDFCLQTKILTENHQGRRKLMSKAFKCRVDHHQQHCRVLEPVIVLEGDSPL